MVWPGWLILSSTPPPPFLKYFVIYTRVLRSHVFIQAKPLSTAGGRVRAGQELASVDHPTFFFSIAIVGAMPRRLVDADGERLRIRGPCLRRKTVERKPHHGLRDLMTLTIRNMDGTELILHHPWSASVSPSRPHTAVRKGIEYLGKWWGPGRSMLRGSYSIGGRRDISYGTARHYLVLSSTSESTNDALSNLQAIFSSGYSVDPPEGSSLPFY